MVGKVSRRGFLGFSVGAAAGTALGVPAARTLSDLVANMAPAVYPPRGTEKFVLTVCQACPGGCGIRARRVGRRVVKLEGNPLHPVNGGRLCPKGQAALQSLYHPDRLPGPMRRKGPRGKIESFQPATWETALAEIGEGLKTLRAAGRPEALAMVSGISRGIGGRLADRFLQAFGSPNQVFLYRGLETDSQALALGQGIRTVPYYDLRGAEYVLSFGSALLEAWGSPVHAMRAFGEFRQGRAGRRGKLVQVESRLSMTGASADEWIQVRPHTEGILALGVAAALVAEGLFQADFVNQRTLGFEDFRDEKGRVRAGLRPILERDYRLEWVTAETGVPVNTILRLAREFAAARPGLAVGSRKGPILSGPLRDHLAAQWLNVLTGNLDQPGGLLVPEEVPFRSWPDLPADPVAEAGRRRPRLGSVLEPGAGRESSCPEAIAEAILEGYPCPVDVLMVLDADPAYAGFPPDQFARAIEKIPLVVSFSSIPDDTALLADWILPQPHFLETWDLVTRPPGVPFPMISLARPVLEIPLHDVRPAGEVFLALARKVGGKVASAFPWPDLPALIRSDVTGLYDAHRGAVMGTEFDEAWVRLMERAGWWAPGFRSPEELWQRVQETGGWWDPFYDHGNWKRVLRNRSGRYEFRPDLLEPTKAGKLTTVAGDLPSDDLLPLILFEPLPIAGGTGAEAPFLQEILDPGLEEKWETWVEIHPDTAGPLQVKDRDWVRIESGRRSIRARARVTTRVVAGAVAVPVGLGRRGGGRWSRGTGSNPLRLLPPGRDHRNRFDEFGAVRVRIRRA